jgi:hypothetical protein
MNDIQSLSMNSQNELYDVKFADVELIRKNGVFTLYIKRNKILDYIDNIFVINDNMFHVHNTTENKWVSYRRVDGDLVELYRSVYMIILYPKLIIEYYLTNTYVYQAGLDYDNNIKTKSLLFVGDNFKIDGGFLSVGNRKQMRSFKYNLKNDDHFTKIIQHKDNTVETKKNKLFFDNTGRLEIYSKKKNELLYNCNKFYKIYQHLYCIKTEDDKYILYDIERGDEIFTGGSLSYIEQFVTLISYNRNEILIIDREKKSIKIFNYDKYKKGETKEYIENINIKKFGG